MPDVGHGRIKTLTSTFFQISVGRFVQVIEAVRMYRPATVILPGDITAELPQHIELTDIHRGERQHL